MGLYLAIFEGDDELEGLEIGSYDDFGFFRDAVVAALEDGVPGSRFPTLIQHSDCDGEWTPTEAKALLSELEIITVEFAAMPPVTLPEGWRVDVAKVFGIKPASFYDCFFDIDGEPLLERLIELAQISQDRNLPILFQ